MGFNLKQLLGKDDSPVADMNKAVSPSLQNPDLLVNNETWQQYGFRMGGRSQGDINVLTPLLQKVTHMMVQEQKEDMVLQDQIRQEKQSLLNEKTGEKEKELSKKLSCESQIDELNVKNKELGAEINKLKSGEFMENKEAKMKLIVGLCILVPFTLYFFIFYSSAAYSAFFADFSGAVENGLSVTIFNSKALGLAFGQSFMTGLFVLMITFLIFALGFVLHYIDTTSKKAGLIAITFIFDFLLAVEIEQNIFNSEALAGIYGPNPPLFTIATALSKINVWMVICCGFVGYIIWGLLFGFVMDSYNELKSNKFSIKEIEDNIKENNLRIDEEKDKLDDINSKLSELDAVINTLKEALNPSVSSIDKNKILKELANFYAGWTNFLVNLGVSKQIIDDSNTIYNNECNNVKSNL